MAPIPRPLSPVPFALVDLELLSAHAQGDMSRLFGQFASLLLFISLLLSLPALSFGGGHADAAALLSFAWSVEHFLIATTMLVVGMFAVLSWDSTFPDRRDILVLAPLPVRARTLFVAKVATVASALSLTVLVFHAAAGLAWPLALNTTAPAQSTPALTTDPVLGSVDATAMEAVLNRNVARALAPGGALAPGTDARVAIGVCRRGVRRVFTYGTARPDSIFEIGSFAKTFTGLLLAQMALQGKVTLDEPVRELLPADTVAQPRGAEITLLDLATHHSGLPRMPWHPHPADKDNPWADWGTADLYEFIAGHGVAKPADAGFLYSNVGFALLGQALANRAATNWPNIARSAITGPPRHERNGGGAFARAAEPVYPGTERIPEISTDNYRARWAVVLK